MQHDPSVPALQSLQPLWVIAFRLNRDMRVSDVIGAWELARNLDRPTGLNDCHYGVGPGSSERLR
jgi:hypothetical protein